VQDADIQVLLAGAPDPMESCRRLTEASRTNGAPDNITVVVARFGGAGLPEPTEADVVRYQPYNPGAGDGDEVDTGLAAAQAAAAAEAAAAAQATPPETTGKLDASGAPIRPTAAGFQAVGVGTAGGPAGAGESANPGAALAATAAAFGQAPGTTGNYSHAGPAGGLTMVPGSMMGYVPPGPPPAAQVGAAPAPHAATDVAPPRPVPLYGTPPVDAGDEELEIPRRGFPIVPILIFVCLVAVLVGVGGYWLLRHASKEGEVRGPAAAAADAAPGQAARAPASAPAASQAASAPAAAAPASQAASRPASQPEPSLAKPPAAEK
jgi:hypothetical protein